MAIHSMSPPNKVISNPSTLTNVASGGESLYFGSFLLTIAKNNIQLFNVVFKKVLSIVVKYKIYITVAFHVGLLLLCVTIVVLCKQAGHKVRDIGNYTFKVTCMHDVADSIFTFKAD